MSDSFTNPAGCDTALYVHVPFCVAKCRYCAFYSEAIAGRDADRLISAMLRELDDYGPIDSVRTVYVGGGSPTALPAGDLTRLVARIASRCPDSREFTVECNPGQTSEHLLSQLRSLGVNRVSFGPFLFRACLRRFASTVDELSATGEYGGLVDMMSRVEVGEYLLDGPEPGPDPSRTRRDG